MSPVKRYCPSCGTLRQVRIDAKRGPDGGTCIRCRGLKALAARATPGPWVDSGLCAQADPDEWFPENGGSTKTAVRLCLSCPVRRDCLNWALGNGERYGVWGGVSERGRRRLADGGIRMPDLTLEQQANVLAMLLDRAPIDAVAAALRLNRGDVSSYATISDYPNHERMRSVLDVIADVRPVEKVPVGAPAFRPRPAPQPRPDLSLARARPPLATPVRRVVSRLNDTITATAVAAQQPHRQEHQS